MKQKTDIPNIVIRPSGVWDTRSPLFQFIVYHRQENQIYYSLLLTISRFLSEARQADQKTVASQLFNHKKSGQMASRAWTAYKNSFAADYDGKRTPPTIADASFSIQQTIPAVTEHAIVSYCALFEAFMQCWAVNYLLAKLESGTGWTSKEKKLANSFSPFTTKHIPNFYQIAEAIPVIKENLQELPHVFTDPATSKSAEVPITSNLTAFQTIAFWREWRNLLVHGSGLVNSKFYYNHKNYWADFKNVFPHISDFQIGKRLSLNDSTFRAVTTVHYRATKSLRNILVEISNDRRGHVRAPGKASKSGRILPEQVPDNVPPMLIEGDHALSFKWANSAEYRKEMKKIFKEA